MKKRLLSLFLVIIMLIACVPLDAIVKVEAVTLLTENEFSNKLTQLRSKYPNGGTYSGTYYENGVAKAWTCYGYACQMFYEVFGIRFYADGYYNKKDYTMGTIYAGDIVRLDAGYGPDTHSVFVTKVTSDRIYFTDGNYNNKNGIRWDASYTKSDFAKRFTYKVHVPGNVLSGNGTHTHSYTEYAYYWAAHPHYKCYECSCGDVKENRSEPIFVSSCDTCKSSICDDNIQSGNYFLKNKSGGYLNIAYGKDIDGTAIHTHEFGNYDSQVYNIYRAKDGYEMMPLCSKTRVVNPYCWTVESGKDVNLYSKTNESSQWWKFQPMGDGFVIRNAQNPQLCLTPYNYAMIVSEYAGKDNQIWYLEKACIINYKANGGSSAPSSHRVRAGYSATISSQKPSRKCYTFLGWSTDKKAKTASIAPGASIKISSDKTLYAVWKENKHDYSNGCDETCNICGEKRSNAHKYAKSTTKATLSKNGKIINKCSVCGKTSSTTTIYAAKTVKLSATSYTYNGKAKTPTVTVKDSKGKTISKSYYTVKYASGRKNVGKYKVTITFKGNYSGTKTLYFTINPVKTSVSKITAAKKALTVTISKKSSQVTGYEIQYATNKKFTKAKTTTVKSYKTTKVTLKKLSAKKTYYVRVRTYKTVGGKKYYSGWSTVKSKKTK